MNERKVSGTANFRLNGVDWARADMPLLSDRAILYKRCHCPSQTGVSLLRLSPQAWFVIAVINFILVGLTSTIIGVDALNERILGGEFFVGLHSHYTQVTEQRYLACLIWEVGTFGGLFLSLAQSAEKQILTVDF
jgi:hypothetical protein